MNPRNRLRQNNLRARKALGQHFLTDPSICTAIVEGASVSPSDVVVEVGPGLGALTRLLAERAGRVIAVEIDTGLADILKEELADLGNVDVINRDFLTMDLRTLAGESGGILRVVGNLPYNITSPILFQLMDTPDILTRATFMVQKEVADRLLAEPGGRDFGIVTVLLGYHAEVSRLFDVSPRSFHPRPRVGSTVIRVDFEKPFPQRVGDERYLRSVVKAAFSMRRKMIKNCLSRAASLHRTEETVMAALESVGIDPNARAETVSLARFVALAETLLAAGQTRPEEDIPDIA